MQSPASNIQSPRPHGRLPGHPQVSFDKELMGSLTVLLNQLQEVERQGLVMFHKIEESFKHPYTQQEAISDAANLLTQLDSISNQSKTNGFSALTMLPTSQTVVSTPSASSAIQSTPKPTFMSPRMQNHINNNLNTQGAGGTLLNNGANIMDISMLSPAPVSLVATPSGGTLQHGGPAITTPSVSGATIASAPSPFPSSDVIMSSTTPAASGNLDASTPAAGGATGSTLGGPSDLLASPPISHTTPATPTANSLPSSTSNAVLTQMMEARQKDVNTQYNEKLRLKSSFRAAAQMTKIP